MKKQEWKFGDHMEILEVGGANLVPPDDEARIMVPQLMKLLEDQDIQEMTHQIIRSQSGGNLEGKQVVGNDTRTAVAERAEGAPRSGSGRLSGLAQGRPSAGGRQRSGSGTHAAHGGPDRIAEFKRAAAS